jgi:hypothetical protein
MSVPHPDVVMIDKWELQPPFNLAGPLPEAAGIAASDQPGYLILMQTLAGTPTEVTLPHVMVAWTHKALMKILSYLAARQLDRSKSYIHIHVVYASYTLKVILNFKFSAHCQLYILLYI